MNMQIELKSLWGQIKRELWEHSMIFKAPLYFMGAALSFVLIMWIATHQQWGSFGLPSDQSVAQNEYAENQVASSNDVAKAKKKNRFSEDFTGKAGYKRQAGTVSILVGFGFTFFYAVFVMQYLLTCLFADRKDGSYLYWRSVPVSETKNVLIKFFVGAGILPWIFFLTFIVFVFVSGGLMSKSADRILGSPGLLNFGLFNFKYMHIPFMWFAGVLWVSPLFSWMLFSSAVAKRSPYLVCVTPLVVIYMIQVSFFDVNYIANFFDYYKSAYLDLFITEVNGKKIITKEIAFSHLLSPAYLLSYSLSAGLISVTIWLRNNRHEI
jgi:ABC-2 type transport system permease protein